MFVQHTVYSGAPVILTNSWWDSWCVGDNSCMLWWL